MTVSLFKARIECWVAILLQEAAWHHIDDDSCGQGYPSADSGRVRRLRLEVRALAAEEARVVRAVAKAERALSKMSAECGNAAYITYSDLLSITEFRNQTVIPIKAPPDTSLNVPAPDGKGYTIHLKSVSGEIEVYLCHKDRTTSPPPNAKMLPADPLLQDNKALLAPLISQMQHSPSTSTTSMQEQCNSSLVKPEPLSEHSGGLEVASPCVTDPTLPLGGVPAPPTTSVRPARPALIQGAAGARDRLRNALIADSDDFAPTMGGGRFQLQTEDQEHVHVLLLIIQKEVREPGTLAVAGTDTGREWERGPRQLCDLEPFLALEPPMSATDYGFSLDHDEGLAELFDFDLDSPGSPKCVSAISDASIHER
ncbi:Transcription factor E2F6 [Eumeta japonica]|uniref:Transcription factor E2F6 n=1 Tax=Eumeta variegata TaxID=151549 RepID=A0A4C1XSB2_EUMVA|nr:Transcription factor E2F6 [Eumeta japonica]